MVDLSKFTSNKKILSGVVIIDYNQVYSQTLSFNLIVTKTKLRFYLVSRLELLWLDIWSNSVSIDNDLDN